MKIVTVNKSASFEYFIEEKFEAGIVLEGAEVKSLRLGKASLSEVSASSSAAKCSSKICTSPSTTRAAPSRRATAGRTGSSFCTGRRSPKIAGKVNRSGYTLVPLKVYFKDALVKVEIALCRGKHTYDKKRSLAERDRKARRRPRSQRIYAVRTEIPTLRGDQS